MSARPRVVTWNIVTLDGRIAISSSIPAWRDERWAPVEQAGFQIVDVAALHKAHVTLEGSNSFVAREAGPAELPQAASSSNLHEDFLPAGVIGKAARWKAVVDSRGRVAWTQTEGEGSHLLVVVSRSTPSRYLAFLREREIPYLLAGEQGVDLAMAVQRLGEALKAETILSEAGGVLNGALLSAALVDEIDLQILPIVVGVRNAPSIFESYGLGTTSRPLRLTLLHEERRSDGSIFVRLIPDKELA